MYVGSNLNTKICSFTLTTELDHQAIFGDEPGVLCFDIGSDKLYCAWSPSCASPGMDLCFHFSQRLCSTT